MGYLATQTHQPTAHTKKACKCRPSRERLKEIRTLDLLHGKQNLQPRFRAQSRWKQRFSSY